jgi:hypothetical protein
MTGALRPAGLVTTVDRVDRVDASDAQATLRGRACNPGVNPTDQCPPNQRSRAIGAVNRLAGLVGPRSSRKS